MAATTVETARAMVPERRVAAGLWSDAWFRLRHDGVTIGAFVALIVMVGLAVAADALSAGFFNYGRDQQDLLNNYTKPTVVFPDLWNSKDPAFWLGGDELGRSQVVRLLYGARVSLAVGFSAALIEMTIGVILGLAVGYFRGWLDDLVQWLVSTWVSIPGLYLLLIFSVLFQPDAKTLVIIIGILSWPGITLFVRGQTLSLRERDFVTAARVIGATPGRIMFRHIFPNVLPLVIILSAISIGTIILIEAALSYLGLGINPPTPSWGNMLTNAQAYFFKAPWMVVAPGAAITLTVLCLYLIGDGLRDALDPRLRGTS